MQVRPRMPLQCGARNETWEEFECSRFVFCTCIPNSAFKSGSWCNNSISPCEGDGPGANPGFLTNFDGPPVVGSLTPMKQNEDVAQQRQSSRTKVRKTQVRGLPSCFDATAILVHRVFRRAVEFGLSGKAGNRERLRTPHHRATDGFPTRLLSVFTLSSSSTGRRIGLSLTTTWSPVRVRPPGPILAVRKHRSSSVVEHVNSQFVSYPSVFQMGRSHGLSPVIGSTPICSTKWGSSSMVEQPPQGVIPRHPLPIFFPSRRWP